MSKADKLNRILPEIDAIEGIIRPFEPYSAEVTGALKAIAEFRESAKSPEQADLSQVLEGLKYAESQSNQYRGQAYADQVIEQLARHTEEIRKIVGEP